jgi:hypothetical protein
MAVDSATILRVAKLDFERSHNVRRVRYGPNERNWDAYNGKQDFPNKTPFQSRETLPDFAIAIEQIVGTFERALTDSDDWASVDPVGFGRPLVPPVLARKLVMFFAENLYLPGRKTDGSFGIAPLIGDGVKRVLLEGEATYKVWPVFVRRTPVILDVKAPKVDGPYSGFDHSAEKGDEQPTIEDFRIAIDLVPFEDYFPDPSPAKQYEIHRTTKYLHELKANPDYNQEAVARLYGRAATMAEEARKQAVTNHPSQAPEPYQIEVFEYWGNLIDPATGDVLGHNVFFAWADNELLRDLSPNPNWDGCSPFLNTALLRQPHSIIPKALADHAVPMWRASNELLNLMLDQAMRAAWGIGQVRADLLEAPEEISDGIPQGYSGVLKPNVPASMRWYERVDNGDVPQMSVEMLNRMTEGMNQALATPDMRIGQMAPRQASATEVVQTMQGSGSLYDSFSARWEDTCVEPLIQRIWKTVLQYAETFLQDAELVQILGPRLAVILSDIDEGDRYKLLQKAKVRVRGIRGAILRDRAFNKAMTVWNVISGNPAALDLFQKRFDLGKFFDYFLTQSGHDPEMFEIDEEGPTDESMPTDEPEPGGQLAPDLLAGGSGAGSPPGELTVAEAQRGMESQFAPTSPAASAVAS